MLSLPDEELDKISDVYVHLECPEMVVPAGIQVHFIPVQSIRIYPYRYRDVEEKPETGPVLLGEMSRYRL